MLWRLVFLEQEPQTGEPNVGLRILTPVEDPLHYNYSPVCGYIMNLSLLPISLWVLLYILSYRRSSLIGSDLFQ